MQHRIKLGREESLEIIKHHMQRQYPNKKITIRPRLGHRKTEPDYPHSGYAHYFAGMVIRIEDE